MEGSNKVCRICLYVYNQSYINVENFKSAKLETVIPEMHFTQLAGSSVICIGCSQLLDDIYNFKYNCLKSEEVILVKISKIKSDHKLHLTDIIVWTDNTPVPLRSNLRSICRLCLKLYEKRDQVINVNELHLLEKHIPELDLNLTLNPNICEICLRMLYKWEDFKMLCLNTESLIKLYQSSFSLQYEDIEIWKVVEFTKTWNLPLVNNHFDSETAEFKPESDKFEVKLESPGTDVQISKEKSKESYNVRSDDNDGFKLIIQETVETVLKPIKRNGIHMYICPKCKKIVKDIDSHLYEHKDIHCKMTYQCNKCNYGTKSKDSLKEHLLSHELGFTEKMYNCPHCSFRAKQKGNLFTHLLIHKSPEEIKMYKCHICKFQSRQKGNLKTHLLTHKQPQEIEMFKCNSCFYQARQKGNLQTHILKKHKHFDDILLEEALMYKCNKCSYKAKQKPSLKKHMRSHEILS